MRETTRSLGILLLAGLLAGCGLFYSKKGQLETRIRNFNAALNRADWADAAKMMTSQVRYFNMAEKQSAAGTASAKAFLNPIIAAQANEIFIHTNEFRKVTDNSYLVLIMLQLRKGDATGSENRFQDFGLLWNYNVESKRWYLAEIKERSVVRTSRS